MQNSSNDILAAESCTFCILASHRFHRTLTGASMLTRIKKGRRSSLSRIASVYMSVVTHRSRHRFVTKSMRSSVELNVCGLAIPFALVVFGVPHRSASLLATAVSSDSDVAEDLVLPR